MFDDFTHRVLRLPYSLHVRYNRRCKNPKATVLFIHGIGSTGDAWKSVVEELPEDLQLITIDLLGFGNSEKPKWSTYDAKTQARSIIATLLKLRLTQPLIIVGHSLGSLVSIEISKRYPIVVKSLILCSPPLYQTKNKRLPNGDRVLREMYKFAKLHPEHILRISSLAVKYRLINHAFSLSEDNIDSYMQALESTIINQTSLNDALKLDRPTTIIRGRFDPVVIPANLRLVSRRNEYVKLKVVNAGHEVASRTYVRSVVRSILEQTHPELLSSKPPLRIRRPNVLSKRAK